MDHIPLTISVVVVLFICGFLGVRLWLISEPPPTAAPTTNIRPATGPMCFRITNIPLHWSSEDLLDALRRLYPSLEVQNHQLSLYPAYTGRTQTALLNLRNYSDILKGPDIAKGKCVEVDDGVDLLIDTHFLGLTPLNTPAGTEVDAE